MVHLDDFAELADDGPFLSIYLPTDSAVQNAAEKSETQWKSLRRTLVEVGAPDAALELVDPLVGDAHLRGESLAVIASAERVIVEEHLEEPIPAPRGSWGPLADVVPIIKARQERVPYVVAWADHGGADIAGFEPGGHVIEDTAGDNDPERKSSPGGWSQPRYQRRADNDWADTAAEASQHVAQVAEDVDARLVVVGGDERATHMIVDHLPKPWAALAAIIEHGRANDGSDETRDAEVRRLVNSAVAEDTVAILEAFKQERGRRDRAVDGMEATADALDRHAVDVLLVRDDEVERDPILDLLVTKAISSGASVRVIPTVSAVRDGVGALLRWSS